MKLEWVWVVMGSFNETNHQWINGIYASEKSAVEWVQHMVDTDRKKRRPATFDEKTNTATFEDTTYTINSYALHGKAPRRERE